MSLQHGHYDNVFSRTCHLPAASLYSQPPPFQCVCLTFPLLRFFIQFFVISLTLTNPEHLYNALTSNTNTGYNYDAHSPSLPPVFGQ